MSKWIYIDQTKANIVRKGVAVIAHFSFLHMVLVGLVAVSHVSFVLQFGGPAACLLVTVSLHWPPSSPPDSCEANMVNRTGSQYSRPLDLASYFPRWLLGVLADSVGAQGRSMKSLPMSYNASGTWIPFSSPRLLCLSSSFAAFPTL